MTELTSSEYYSEVKSLAETIAAEAMADNDNDRVAAEDDINDSRLHETIDGHRWIMYDAYNLSVIQHSDNSKAYRDCYSDEDAGRLLSDKGIGALHAAIAFFALYQDVSDRISDELDKIEATKSEAA